MSTLPSFSIVLDAVILFALLECLALLAYRRFTGRGLAASGLLATMGSGLCLMLALRCLVNQSGLWWAALFLMFSGVAHAVDISLRWRRSPATESRFHRVVV